MGEKPLDLRFVREFQSFNSVRERELESSERRAHAARAVQLRRRQSQARSSKKSDQALQNTPSKGFKIIRATIRAKHDVDKAAPDPEEVSQLRGGMPLCRAQACASGRVSIAHLGNSDPFRSRAVNITADINRIVTFTRDVGLPSLYGSRFYRDCTLGNRDEAVLSERSTMITSRAAARHWEQTLATLDNKGAAFACLATFLSILSHSAGGSTHGNDSVASLAMRTKSSAMLREQLRRRHDIGTIERSTLWHMFWLLGAACFSGDSDAAVAHSGMIWKLVRSGTATAAMDNHLLFLLVVVDVDLAVKIMTRPLFDAEFFSKRMQPLWERASVIVPPLNLRGVGNVHESVNFEPAREAMINDRLFKSFALYPLPGEIVLDGSSGDVLFSLLSSQSFNDTSRLLNHYHDIIEGQVDGASSLTEGQLSIRAAIDLAVLQSIRSTGKDAYIQGVDIREISYLLVWHMHSWIVKTAVRLTEEELVYYRDARLWILFVGTLYVLQQEASRYPAPGLERLPFAELLVRECKSIGLNRWHQMRALLADFTYCEVWEPHGSLWFEKMLQDE